MTKRYTFMVVILMLSLAIFACAIPGSGVDEAAEAVVAEVAEQVEEAVEEEIVEEVAEQVEEAVEEEASSLEGASLDELDSYRMITRMSVEAPDGSWMPSDVTEIAVVNNPPPHAEHFVMTDPMGSNTIETITIGDRLWMNMDGTWMELPATDSDEASVVVPQAFELPSDLRTEMSLVGTEVVNGVNCEHYTFDSEISSEDMAEMMGGAVSSMPTFNSHVVGEIWIAAEPGLPPVAVRSDMTQTMDMGESEMVMRVEFELSDINETITIEPPSIP